LTGSDLNMTWSSFLEYYRRLASEVSRIAAYDYTKNIWVYSPDALSEDSNFRMVILTMQDGFKIRIEIVPETQYHFTIARESLDSHHIWQQILHIPITGSELEILKLLKMRLPSRASIIEICSALEMLSDECHNLIGKLTASITKNRDV